MPPAAGAVVSAGLGLYGQHQAQRQQNQYLQQAARMFSPQQIMSAAQQYNPQLFSAMRTTPQGAGFVNPFQQRSFGDWLDWQSQIGRTAAGQGYQGQLNLMAQMPGYIDPALMNANVFGAQAGANQAIQRASSLVGGDRGGLSQLYPMAAQGMANRTIFGQIFPQYNLARTELARQDVSQLEGMRQAAINQAMGGATGGAGYLSQQTPPLNFPSALSSLASTGLAAYGAFQQPQTQRGSGVPTPPTTGYRGYFGAPNYAQQLQQQFKLPGQR